MTCGSLLRKVFRVVQELVKSRQNLIQSTARLSEHADFGRPQRSAESGRERSSRLRKEAADEDKDPERPLKRKVLLPTRQHWLSHKRDESLGLAAGQESGTAHGIFAAF